MAHLTFWQWLFEKRDVNGVVVTLLISTSLTLVIQSVSVEVLKPVLQALIPDWVSRLEVRQQQVAIKWNSVLVPSAVFDVLFAFLLVSLSLRFNRHTVTTPARKKQLLTKVMAVAST